MRTCRRFPEADVQKLVPAVTRSLVTQMRGFELAPASWSDHVLFCLGSGQQIAESLLILLPELTEPWQRAHRATTHLDYCSRALDELQRRKICFRAAYETVTGAYGCGASSPCAEELGAAVAC